MEDYPGLNTAIVTILRKYGTPLPVDYLASLVGRRESDIEDYLHSLEEVKIIGREGEMIFLATDKNLVKR